MSLEQPIHSWDSSMSKHFAMGLILFLGLFLCCGNERKQQRAMARDYNVIRTAAVMHVDLPPAPEDTFTYGQGNALMKILHERYVRLAKVEEELVSLFKGSDPWTYPMEWTDAEKIKTYRSQAEHLLVLLNEYQVLVDGTTGTNALQSIKASGLSYRGQKIFTEGIASQTVVSERTQMLITLIRSWGEKEVELLTLLDEKRESMDGSTPLFPKAEQAERFRKLQRQIQEERQFLVDPLAGFEDAQARLRQQLQTEARKL
jgi:hypothetical protein